MNTIPNNPFTNLLSHRPKWIWWLGGLVIAALYVWGFYTFFVSPTGLRWKGLYGDPDYPQDYEIQGIDISHYQGEIDWPLLRTAYISKCPVRFVIIKATEGASIIDENFTQNFNDARENGFIRGAYHFWSNKTSPREQAQFFIDKVPLEEGDLPPILDVEHKPKDRATEDFQRDVLTWLHAVENKFHVKPIIYTYYKFKQAYLDDSRFDDYPYWIAHYYVKTMQYPGEWKFWQHTDAGHLPGVEGEVDFDVYNGSFYDLQQLCIRNVEPNYQPVDTIDIDY